ncbi:helix-turn-helix domain-containing protein [Qipengyuania gaetbuli]|uniref:helix-turn-helix domain-containing protein n=1 Tax=Qipengyuania gaetbuli TaxID=266952 RepID=UPI001CD39DDB|nr:AraC family transcriptional regulator [Qipengyuania gaetbuli]MCA0910280.1 AraC family transcriptional regulator [Qipengyuania gaetbuli]
MSSIHSNTGSTPKGMPLSLNRSPHPDLRHWLMRVGVTSVDLPAGASIECASMCEHPVLRMIYGAKWTAETADGEQEFEPGEEGMALYFGPETRAMKLKVHGSFRVVSVNCTSGFAHNFDLPTASEMLDRILPIDPLTGHAIPHEGHRPQDDPVAWLDACEAHLHERITSADLQEPHGLLEAFEWQCLTAPNASLADFADTTGVTRRTLERTINRHWGVTPKFALRRARALDMAAALLGVADEEEEPELRLRYFDQSHLSREMRHFFDQTPRGLQVGDCPLLRITMEIRQSRRLEALAKLSADEPAPWRDPDAEPDTD